MRVSTIVTSQEIRPSDRGECEPARLTSPYRPRLRSRRRAFARIPSLP